MRKHARDDRVAARKRQDTSSNRRRARVEAATGDAPKDLRFWRAQKPETAVFALLDRIRRQTKSRRDQDLYYACLYDDAELATLIQGAQATGEFTPQTLNSNIVKRQVDAFVAKISKNRPVPMGLTTGGNYSQQRRAKALSKFYEGVLDSVKYWDTRQRRLTDGAVWGSGFALNYRVGRKLFHDRLLDWEVYVDPREAMFGNPRTLIVRRFVDRLVLMERYPDLEEELQASASRSPDDAWEVGWEETSDLVQVAEAWHLPSADDMEKTDGCHVICVSNATLANDAYDRDYFPISKWDFSPPLIGWRGEGMVKGLAGLQYEVNSVGLRLQEMNYLMGSYVLIEDQSGVDMDLVDNGSLTEVRYRGTKPEFQAPAGFPPGLFQWYQQLRGVFPGQETGMSSLSTQGEKPAGVDSGKGLRTYHDIETETFTPQGRRDEQDVIDTCWQLFDLAEEIYEESKQSPANNDAGSKPYTVKIEQRKHGKSVLEEISYADVRLDREQFTLRVFPTNFLASTPSERFSDVKDMVDSGFLSQDEALSLLDFPDTEHVLGLKGAARRNVERIVERILEAPDPSKPDVVILPEPVMNLDLCIALGMQMYLEAKLDGASEKNLKALLDWIQYARDERDGKDEGDGGMPPDAAAAEQQYAPPDQAPLPANAVAPTAMPAIPPAPPGA